MIASVRSEDCVKMEDPKYLNCTLVGNNQELNVSSNINGSNQSIVKELRINGFVLKNLSNAFVNMKSLEKLFITNCTGLSSTNQSFSNQQLSYIEITSTDLDFVSEKMFSQLTELNTLKVNNNKIKEIHKDAFKDLLKLESIEMDQNNIETLPDDVFVNNLNLKLISCQNNTIEKLTSKTFSGCLKVTEIRLQNNWINEIVENFDQNLSSLESIYLKGNVCIKSDLISKQNWTELRTCYYQYLFIQNLTTTLNDMNSKIKTNNSTRTVTPVVNPIDVKVIESVNQLEQKLTQLKESKSRHQYFIYFVLILLTAFVIYGYLLIYRRYYYSLPTSTYNTSDSNIQLM